MSDREFLGKLKTAAQHYGWQGDYNEVTKFVLWVYEQYGYQKPTQEQLAPFVEKSN